RPARRRRGDRRLRRGAATHARWRRGEGRAARSALRDGASGAHRPARGPARRAAEHGRGRGSAAGPRTRQPRAACPHRQRRRRDPSPELSRWPTEADAVRSRTVRFAKKRTRPQPPRRSAGPRRPRRGRAARGLRLLFLVFGMALVTAALLAGTVLFWATRPGPGQGERVNTRWTGRES